MKILMVTPYLPYPPESGGQIRTLNLLKYLRNSHKITLISLYKNDEEKKYAAHLESFCSKIYLCKRPEKPWQINILAKAIFTLKPLLIVRNFSIEARDLLEKLLQKEKFDVIHAETFYVMPHLPKTKLPILLVEQTIEYKVYQHFVDNLLVFLRPFFYADILKLNYWERYYWKKASTVATVSQHDKEIIRKVEPKINPVIIPNGAGDEMFAKTLPQKRLNKPILLFIGNFYWLQNKEAASYLVNKILPLLNKYLTHFKVVIAGQEAKKLKFKKIKNLEIINFEPEDNNIVKSLYQGATLFIAPIYGPGGTRLKILASMAAGLPVVSTKTGIEGLDIKDNIHVLVAKSPQDFIEKIKKILADKKLYEKLQKNSYIKVKETYSWDTISKKLEIVYKTIKQNNENRN